MGGKKQLPAHHERIPRAVVLLDMTHYTFHDLEERSCLWCCCMLVLRSRSMYVQFGPAVLSSCAQCSLVRNRQHLFPKCLLLHILFSSARARSRSSFVLIALISSIVYGGGPGGAMFAISFTVGAYESVIYCAKVSTT